MTVTPDSGFPVFASTKVPSIVEGLDGSGGEGNCADNTPSSAIQTNAHAEMYLDFTPASIQKNQYVIDVFCDSMVLMPPSERAVKFRISQDSRTDTSHADHCKRFVAC
jgi:hypothetical protein